MKSMASKKVKICNTHNNVGIKNKFDFTKYLHSYRLITLVFIFCFSFINVYSWNQFRGDQNRTGASDASLSSSMGLKWKVISGNSSDTFGFSSLVSTTINNHTYVYNCKPGGVLEALDSTLNGNRVWSINLPGKSATALAVGTCSTGTAVFVASNDGYIGAYDAGSGSTIWEIKTNEIIYSSPLYYNELSKNFIAVSTNSGNILKIDADNGNIIWTVNPGKGIASLSGLTYIPGSAGTAGGLCYGTEAGKIICISSASGVKQWSVALGGPVRAPGAYVDGKLYSITSTGKLYVLAATSTNGSILTYTSLDSYSSISVKKIGSIVYIAATGQGNVDALTFNPTTHLFTSLWSNNTGNTNNILSSGILSGTNYFTAMQNGIIKGYDLLGGANSSNWIFNGVNSTVYSSMAINVDDMAVISNNGNIFGFSDRILTVEKSVDKSTANFGDTLTYILKAKNNSTINSASNVSVVDLIPANGTFLDANPAPTDTTKQGKLIWQLSTLSPGSEMDITLRWTANTYLPILNNAYIFNADFLTPVYISRTPVTNILTATITPTFTITITPSPTISATPGGPSDTSTFTATQTNTFTNTQTITNSCTSTSTMTCTNTITPVFSETDSATFTPTATMTSTFGCPAYISCGQILSRFDFEYNLNDSSGNGLGAWNIDPNNPVTFFSQPAPPDSSPFCAGGFSAGSGLIINACGMNGDSGWIEYKQYISDSTVENLILNWANADDSRYFTIYGTDPYETGSDRMEIDYTSSGGNMQNVYSAAGSIKTGQWQDIKVWWDNSGVYISVDGQQTCGNLTQWDKGDVGLYPSTVQIGSDADSLYLDGFMDELIFRQCIPMYTITPTATITCTQADTYTMTTTPTITMTETPGITLGQAVDDTSHTYDTGGSGNWFGEQDEMFYGTSAARSAKVWDTQNTYMETTVSGPGTLVFYWKVSSEQDYDYLSLYRSEEHTS